MAANPYEQYADNPYAQITEPQSKTDAVVEKVSTAYEKVKPYSALVNPLMALLGNSMASLDRTIYDAGGSVTDAAVKRGATPETAATLGYLTNVGANAGFSWLTGKGAELVAAPAMKSGAKSLMQSALKPTYADLKSGDAGRAIDTMLKQGFSVSKGSVDDMHKLIDKLDNEVSAAIQGSPAMINKVAVGQRLRDLIDKFKNQVNPQADLADIRQAWTNFANHPDLKGKLDIPVDVAQKMKRGTYSVLAKKYGEQGSASTEAQKALARGLKEEISAAVPGVAEKNNAAGDLINAANVTNRRVLMDANKNPLGLGALLSQPWMLPVWMWDRSPWAKSMTARAMYSGAERIPQAAGSGLGALYMMQNGQIISPEEGVLAE